ncbi:MAG: PilZ domain-containing protein [Calditrichaceae bacterium]|nr:PilZ domain-containing protein [Calditrichaceae bacterium]
MKTKPIVPRISTRLASNAGIDTTVSGRQKLQFERLNDISFEGLSFESDVAYRKGAILTITIPVTQPAFRVISEVVWCKPNGGNYKIGTKFLQIQNGYRMKMLEQLTFIETYRKKVFFDENRSLSCEQAYSELKNYFQYQRH